MSFPKKQLIVLHKSGANSHYKGLQLLANQQGYTIIYREFSILSRFIKSITKLEGKLFVKQCKNLLTLVRLMIEKDQKVILGIAPYDKTLLRLRKTLSRHQIYYHTSWPLWDEVNYPKKKGATSKVKFVWREFLENEVEQIFTVTEIAKHNLINFYNLKQAPQVVGHSYDQQDFYMDTKYIKSTTPSFCYVGRLVEQKGILELLELFKLENNAALNIIGDGPLKNHVKQVASSHNNIIYHTATNDKTYLNKVFNESHYLLLNSKRTSKWQELFGMVIIEAMAAGCIPVATDHVGPKEIITHHVNGYLFEENSFMDQVKTLLKEKPSVQIRENAQLRAQDFEVQQVANYWKLVIKTQS